ncbi:MAG: SDR family NAD(P)-dependent oxidoreductase [Acetobacteraceae bacterium]|nr:SDR family NAD(P)-dependent oxidoreductase [Acetobacteraceae bacterium]MSP30912.1 SDR family NAD(P)-dependent oxidoreductase [Acetobacteraceae bacterium]
MAVLADSVALVTGASRGLGAATAVALAGMGAHVVITGRTQGGLEETDDAIRAAGGAATLLPFDLAATETIDALGPSIHARFGRLDILVHAAAALGVLTPVAHIQKKDFDTALAANMTATWHLIATCAPLLAVAQAGRAVFVTSAVARAPRAYWGIYGATKAAMEHFASTWAEETRASPLRVNLFDPGKMATRLRRDAYPGEDQSLLPKPADIAPLLAALCLPTETRTGELIGAA